MNEKQSVKLSLDNGVLCAVTPDGLYRKFSFPAAAVSFDDERFEASVPAGNPLPLPNGGWMAEFSAGPCRFKVTVTPGEGNWFFKQVEVVSDTDLPTPDYLEVDFQKQRAEGLECRGYTCTSGAESAESLNDEQGSGVVPGCGYPLVGKDMFTGIEHPAAFNTIVSEEDGVFHWRLRHFPVWENRKITSYRAVIGLSNEPLELFYEYLDTLRLPVLKKPLIAFCSFWSDPYAGNFEYIVTRENYDSLIDAFNKLGLRPDIYTLDAGWQDRNSILRTKECCGGEDGLMDIGRKVRSAGADLSLWMSPNGPVGIAGDFLRSRGIAVGKGASCHYSYGEYGVLIDERLEKELTDRACELVSDKYKVCHFKVDWDNECATTCDFKEKYPTRNHVREASINVMARINRAARAINPALMTRNGRWPSPWYLHLTTHVSLPNGGDCEYGSLPALSQRDASSNHRDFLYWCVFCRDRSVFPLDVLDNHEFSHSIRNPFQETPGVWSNTCVWAVLRGSSYHQYTLMPEALEDEYAEVLRRTMAVLRAHPEKILTGRSRMIGGNPLAGSVYGFVHPGRDGSAVIGLRNSLPIPVEYTMPQEFLYYEQSYPDCRRFCAGEKVVFAPHEVKVLSGRNDNHKFLPDSLCQLVPDGNGNCLCYLPASQKPDVLDVHRIPELRETYRSEQVPENGIELAFGVMTPWRMRDFKLILKVNKKDCTAEQIQLRTSRLKSCRESSYTVPLAEIPAGLPGSGERKNSASVPERTSRFFAADMPQGGEVFFSLSFDNRSIAKEDLELWLTGYEAPARQPEETLLPEPADTLLFIPHPQGFPRNLRLL